MKIGISCLPSIGGSGILASTLGLELAKRGHQIHFINYQRPVLLTKTVNNVFFHPVQLTPYQVFRYLPHDFALTSRMMEMLKNLELDILHAHYIVPYAISAYFAKIATASTRTKIIANMHGTDITFLAKDPSYQEIMKYVLERVDGLISVSNYLKDECNDALKLSREIKVIHNFVDTDNFKPKKDKKFREKFAAPNEKIVLHISNMRTLKRVTDVIVAFALVEKKLPCRLVMVGEGPETSKAKALCEKLKITDKVSFLGERIHRVPIINVADVFLLPSEFESFGLAALEAMSCGIPCIITKNGGTNELVREGVDGFFIRPGDIDDIADKLLTLLANEELCLAMGERARQSAVDQFAVSRIVDEYENYYRSICKNL